jgi:hypothetical protein
MKVVFNQGSFLKLKDPRVSTYRIIGYNSGNHCTLHDEWICTKATFWIVRPDDQKYGQWVLKFFQLLAD